MPVRFRNSLATFAVASAMSCLWAGPVATVLIPDIVNRADSIVTGTLRGTVVSGRVSLTIDIERVLKGSLTPGSVINASWNTGRMESFMQLPTGYGLCFLGKGPRRDWIVLPLADGDTSLRDLFYVLPARRRALSLLDQAASPLDKVFIEITSAVEKNGVGPLDLIGAFRATKSQVLRQAFARFAQNSSPRVSMLGLQGRIAAGDATSIAAVRALSAALSNQPGGSAVLDEIKYYFLNPDPPAVSELGITSTSPTATLELRMAAVSALAKIHTRESLPYLVQLLDSSDAFIRACAVGGLANYANNVPIGSHEPAPGTWPYRNDYTIAHSAMDAHLIGSHVAYYTGFWKDWWNKNRAALGQ